MICISPILIKVPDIDKETGEYRQTSEGIDKKIYKRVPCGKCFYCLQKKRGQWLSRMEYQAKKSKSAHFVTLTYADENLPFDENGNPMVSKRDVQLFLKRLRKNTGSHIKYFLVAEYGPQTQRPHYHAIMFGLSVQYLKDGTMIMVDNDEVTVNVTNAWQNGHVTIYPAEGATLGYVCKYHSIPKTLRQPKHLKNTFTLMSRRPGIGDGYVDDYKDYHVGHLERNFYTTENGVKRSLPRYWKDRLYSVYEREAYANWQEEKVAYQESLLTPAQLKKYRKQKYSDYEQFERKTLKNFKQRNKI